MYKPLLIILISCCAKISLGQQQDYLFQHLGVKDGLYEEHVHAIQQDAKGFIWLNFRSLIQRFDGHRFVNFLPGKQLPEGNIRSMLVDNKNRLWLLGGDNALGYLNPDNFKYTPVKVNLPQSYNSLVTGMYIDKDERVMLISGKQGFVTYNDETGVADAANNPFTLPAGWEPLHLWQDDERNYWAATVNGLLKFNALKKSISYRGHNIDNDPVIKAFEQMRNTNAFYIDKKKNCWLVSWQGGLSIHSFNILNGQKKEWRQLINMSLNEYFVPFGFLETAGDHLWLWGDNLFCKINTAAGTAQVIPKNASGENSIRYDIVFFGYEDREQNIWLATNKGLFRFNPPAQKFAAVTNRRNGNNKLAAHEVTDFLETSNGELLVSTWGSGIFAYDQKLQPSETSYLLNKHTQGTMAWSMIQRANGDIWCGMQGGTIFIFEAGTKKFYQTKPAVLAGITVRQLAEDKNGNIWLGTHSGAVIVWNAASRSFIKHQQFNGSIIRIYVDAQNFVWAGTDLDGVYRLNSSTGKIVQHYSSKAPQGKKLLINGIADILQYNDSIFYIAGNGLSILNTKTDSFTYFTIANGLPSANITNLVKDRNGYIWMTTGTGIVSYHPPKQKLSIYTSSDGVHNYSFSIGAATSLKNGTIAFGTSRDFILFHPGALKSIKYVAPKVQVAGFEVQGKPLLVDSLLKMPVIELSSNQHGFKIQFASLRYQDVYSVFYMIEGMDKNWKKTGKEGVVEYNYLPAGTYKLKAACFEEDGTPGDITTLTIHLAAPFYKTWWFYSVIALLLVGFLFWLDKQRMKRKAAVEKMRSDIAANLHEEVNTALNNIHILSELAKLKADKDIERSKEYIQQIHSKSNYMITALNDMLWNISPENDSMQKIIERFNEHMDALRNRFGVDINVVADEKIAKLKLNMKIRQHVFWFLKNGSTNIVKAGATHCNIHLGIENTNLIYTLDFDSSHADLDQLNNILLRQELANKIQEANAVINIRLLKPRSVIVLTIPVN